MYDIFTYIYITLTQQNVFSKDLYTYSVGKVINIFNSSFMGPEMAGAMGRTTTPI